MRTTANIHIPNAFEGLVSELFNGKLFGEGDSTLAEQFYTYPPVNISESEHAFHIAILAPGRKKEDIKISLEKTTLTIRYEAPTTEAAEGTKIRKTEFGIKNFNRSFTISDAINTDSISAKYENGILHLELAKKEEVKLENKTIVIE